MRNKNLNILIADDDQFYLSCLTRYFSNNYSCSISTFTDEESLHSYSSAAPDFILTSLFLGGYCEMSRINTGKLKDRFPQSRILILSVSEKYEEAHREIHNGAHACVVKDANYLTRLSQIINSIIL